MTRAGQQLGAYELLRPLGAGGMAETFVAVRRGPANFEQRVCLKRILPGCAADPLFVELFLDEARLLARMQCANITHVHDFGEIDGTYYMALELIDGVDLEGLLSSLRERGERMPEAVALHVVTEILVALDYAHTLEIDGEPQNIVHRDISPSNILLSKTGEVKLTDFGIAKSSGRSHRTQAGHTKGKIAYMSPEQMRAEELDGRSDLFALGVVLFELLTGAHPFEADTDFALQVNIMQGKRRPLRELLPKASERISKLLDTLLATDRADRPASAGDAIALIPQSESSFALQRGLEALVKQRLGVKGSRVNTGGSRPGASGSKLPDSLSHSQPRSGGSGHPASARGTTADGAPHRRGRKNLLWAAIAMFVLGLGYALSRRAETAQRPTPSSLPKLAGSVPALPVAIPEAAAPRIARESLGAVPPDRRRETDPPAAADKTRVEPTSAGQQPAFTERGSRTSRATSRRDTHRQAPTDAPPQTQELKERDPNAELTQPERPPSSLDTRSRSVAPPLSSASPPAPVLATPAAPSAGPTSAHTHGDSNPTPPRATYVTPSGRVVIAAPPL